jgi:hypothetical protein
MKTILVCVAFAAVVALPTFAPSLAAEGPSYSRLHPPKKYMKRHSYRGLDGSAWNSYQPASNGGAAADRLCSTAPEFCPDYHGANG